MLDELAALKGAVPLSKLMLQTYPDYNEAKLRGVRNLYWNAFKHLMNRDGVLRDDEKLLARFDDSKNDTALFVGWRDYVAITRKFPIEAQVFITWWFAINGEEDEANMKEVRAIFPGITTVDRTEQKRRLRRAVEKTKKDRGLAEHPATEELHQR